jgi:hypothetical protein
VPAAYTALLADTFDCSADFLFHFYLGLAAADESTHLLVVSFAQPLTHYVYRQMQAVGVFF